MSVLNGTNSSEVLNGTASNDTIYGFGGSDTINGLSGDDALYGDLSGSDTVIGAPQELDLGRTGGYSANNTTQRALFKDDWFGTSNVVVTGRGFDDVETTYNGTLLKTFDQNSPQVTFGSTFGIGVTGAYPGGAVKSEIGYNSNNGKTECLSFEWSGGYVSTATVELAKFFNLAAGFDKGTEVGEVRAFLKGAEVDLSGAQVGGSGSGVAESGLGLKLTADSAAGDFKFNISGANFDKLVFSTRDYSAPTNEYKTEAYHVDSSDYYIQHIKYTFNAGKSTTAAAPYNDNISGGEGEDSIYGNQGDDYISGGTGNDLLFGDKDKQEVTGYVTYNDTIAGDDGKDTIYGNCGADSLSGGSGSDLIYGADGTDSYNPDSWEISYFLAEGEKATPTRTFPEDSHDTLLGGGGKDTLYGENGNDLLNGGSGDDRLIGGHGSDTFQFDTTTMGRDVILDFDNGADKINLAKAGIKIGMVDKNADNIVDHRDVLIYNGSMIITFEPLPIYHNFIVVLGTDSISTSDFIFAA